MASKAPWRAAGETVPAAQNMFWAGKAVFWDPARRPGAGPGGAKRCENAPDQRRRERDFPLRHGAMYALKHLLYPRVNTYVLVFPNTFVLWD
jgi:hypothetical protein